MAAKFCGTIGIVETVETAPSVWTEQVVEKKCYGDILKNYRSIQSGESINDNVVIKHSISILADSWVTEHIGSIRYVSWLGTKWKVSSIEVDRPRITLELDGVYNGK